MQKASVIIHGFPFIIQSSRIKANPQYILPRLATEVSLPEQPGSDISHLTIIQLLVSASICIDANKAESRYDSFHIESHAAEPINQIFVVSAVSEVQL